MHELLSTLWEVNVTLGLAVLVIAALRHPYRRRFGSAATLGLWGIAPAALIAILLPAQSTVVWVERGAAGAEVAATTASLVAVEGDRGVIEALVAAWILGAMAMLWLQVSRQRRFRRELGRLNAWRGCVLRSERDHPGPVVLGPWRPFVVIPRDFEQRFSREQRRWIMAHECSHLRRGDMWLQSVAACLRVVCWFDPLVHLADALLRRDMELAADAEVIQRFPRARRRYAETLLNVQLAAPGLPVGCLWQSSHPLKERILMLKTSPASTPLGPRSVLVASGLALLAGGIAWAGQPDRQKLRVVERATHSAKLTLTYGTETASPEVHFRDDAQISAEMGEGDGAFMVDIALDRIGDRFTLKSSVDRGGRSLAAYRSEFAQNTQFNQVMTIEGQDTPLTIDGIVAVLPTPGTNAGAATMTAASSLSTSTDAGILADPKPINQPAPAYPAEAEASGSTGKVVVRVLIGASGQVTKAEVHKSSGHAALDDAARTAVLGWSFAPARRGGVPVPAEVVVPICFALDTVGEADCEPEDAADTQQVI